MPKFTKTYDLAAALPLVVLYFLGIAALVSKLHTEWADLAHGFSAVIVMSAIYQITTMIFVGLMLTLFIVRRKHRHD